MAKTIRREKDKTYLYLIRHAHFILSPSAHSDHSSYNPPIPLSKKGNIEAKSLAKRLFPLRGKIDVFYCSSMKRANQTAKAIAKTLKMSPIQTENLWEFNKLLWTRKYYHPKWWKHWIKHRRTIRAIDEILRNHRGKVILIVAHGNVIKGILKNKQKLSLKKIRNLNYKNCYITLMKFDGTRLEKTYRINAKNPYLLAG
ncbi:MAG: histidine phosphatase family protein [Nanoarchaeota archaeon]